MQKIRLTETAKIKRAKVAALRTMVRVTSGGLGHVTSQLDIVVAPSRMVIRYLTAVVKSEPYLDLALAASSQPAASLGFSTVPFLPS